MRLLRLKSAAQPNQSSRLAVRRKKPAVKARLRARSEEMKTSVKAGESQGGRGLGKRPCSGLRAGSERTPWFEKSSTACGSCVAKWIARYAPKTMRKKANWAGETGCVRFIARSRDGESRRSEERRVGKEW